MRLWPLLLLAALACAKDDTDSTWETDTDTDTDTDSDTDTDTDTDSDTDVDVIGDPDTDEPEDTGEVECDDVTPVELFVSPDDSNSMSSPVQARLAVESDWASLSSVPIRTYEFMNYYSFAYPPAPANRLSVHVQMLRSPDSPEDEFVVQVGVSSAGVTNEERRPMNLTLVLDRSGSMAGSPIQRLKDVCRAIAASLKPGDLVSMVEWSTTNSIMLDSHAVSGPNDAVLLAKVASLAADGGTNLHAGLMAGYALAEANRDVERINRVVLISDGNANVGITDVDFIAAKAGGIEEDGIYLVGVGVDFPSSTYDELMDRVTDAGKGASVFVGSEDEAFKMFHTRFVSTMDVAGRDVRVRLDLPPGFEMREFSGEEYSEDPSEVEPQHISPSDAMVFYQTLETCAPELIDDDTALGVHVWWKEPISFTQREISEEYTFGELLAGEVDLLHKGAAIYEYAEGLKSVAGKPTKGSLERAEQALEVAEEAHPGDPDLAEIRWVLDQLP